MNCKERCSCKNGAKCDPITGQCQCAIGYNGAQCETPCPSGKFGVDCSQNCTCENGATCNVTSGKCICLKGFIGNSCENKRKLFRTKIGKTVHIFHFVGFRMPSGPIWRYVRLGMSLRHGTYCYVSILN